jgi:Putative zinc-finger
MADPEEGWVNGEHPDEGSVHAWLDGQLSAADAARIESHVAGCAACAATVAEARGFMAASSRILTGLDGVPARVMPRSRSRVRTWQVRAAAAVLVVALGAAAVLSDTGGRFIQLGRETAAPQPPAAVTPALAPAKTADTGAAPPPATRTSPSPPSVAFAKPRAGALAPPAHETSLDNKKETALNERETVVPESAMQAGTMQKTAQPPASSAARAPSGAPLAATRKDQTVSAAAQAAPAAALPPARSALGAKASPSVVEGLATPGVSSDSPVSANVARAFSVRRLASNAAYRRCAGKLVSVSEPAGASGGAAHVTTIRLDSVAQSPPVRGFVVAAPGGGANLDGWWVPAGADSAVVSLNPRPPSGAAAGDLAASDSAAAAVPATVTRVRCESP